MTVFPAWIVRRTGTTVLISEARKNQMGLVLHKEDDLFPTEDPLQPTRDLSSAGGPAGIPAAWVPGRGRKGPPGWQLEPGNRTRSCIPPKHSQSSSQRQRGKLITLQKLRV